MERSRTLVNATTDMIIGLSIALATLPVSLALTRFFMSWNAAHGIYGVDIHKLRKPRVPEMCGAAMPLAMVIVAGVFALAQPQYLIQSASFIIVVGSAAIVGAVDDFRRMGGIFKPLLGLLCGAPLTIIGLAHPAVVYNADLRVPFFGGFHIPIIYPLAIPIAVSITANTVNMLDPLNGVMSGGIAIACLGLVVGIFVSAQGGLPVFLFATIMFASLGFFVFNRFPSRAFSGNVGQISLGAAIGAAAILGRVEIATVVAIFPNIQNSFFFLSRIRRFTEHRRLTSKPTTLLPDGRLSSTPDRKAPLTLVRTVIVGKPSTEDGVVNTILGMYAISSILGLITLLLMGVNI